MSDHEWNNKLSLSNKVVEQAEEQIAHQVEHITEQAIESGELLVDSGIPEWQHLQHEAEEKLHDEAESKCAEAESKCDGVETALDEARSIPADIATTLDEVRYIPSEAENVFDKLESAHKEMESAHKELESAHTELESEYEEKKSVFDETKSELAKEIHHAEQLASEVFERAEQPVDEAKEQLKTATIDSEVTKAKAFLAQAESHTAGSLAAAIASLIDKHGARSVSTSNLENGTHQGAATSVSPEDDASQNYAVEASSLEHSASNSVNSSDKPESAMSSSAEPENSKQQQAPSEVLPASAHSSNSASTWRTAWHTLSGDYQDRNGWLVRTVLTLLAVVLIAVLAHQNSQSLQAERALLKQIQLQGAHITQLDSIAITNQLYLKQVEQQGLDDLVKIVEITGILNVVASSQIGVSFIADFNVTVGHILQDLNAALKRGIEINMASVAAVRILGLIARVAHFIAPYLMMLCVVLWSIYALLVIAREKQWLTHRALVNLHMTARHISMVFVFVHLLLPYSLHFSSLLAHEMSTEIHHGASDKLTNVHGIFSNLSQQKALKERAESSIHHLKGMDAKHVHKQTENLFAYLLWRMVLTLFNLVLMPLAILTALFFLARALLPRPAKAA